MNNDPQSASSAQPSSPLGLSFFKNLGGGGGGGSSGDKKLKADGQPPKRRGPKPDSKPAQTRRQELNRQAQRTHRERKEQYLKALETELHSQRTKYENACKELDAYRDENSKLKEILARHGIPFYSTIQSPKSNDGSHSYFSENMAAASSSASSPPPLSQQQQQQQQQMGQPLDQTTPVPQWIPPPTTLAAHNIDYTQFAKDFVKSLELPCSDHQQMLCTRALDPEADPSGHALMATCPPREHVMHHPNVPYPHQLPNIGDGDLIRLFDLSQNLPEELLQHGEISPVEAWRIIWNHEQLQDFSLGDLFNVQDVLMSKVRCYGYGAVLESFEVIDAMNHVESMKEQSLTPRM